MMMWTTMLTTTIANIAHISLVAVAVTVASKTGVRAASLTSQPATST